MKFLHHNTTEASCWETYKALELIPSATCNPQINKFKLAFGLKQIWRLLLVALTQELVYEQQIEYLERCWAIDRFESNGNTDTNTLQKLWTLMN